MGSQQACIARYLECSAKGLTHLETDSISFTSPRFRVKISRERMGDVFADDSILRVEGPDGTLILQLGSRAQNWAQKILNPPGLIEKPGIKPAHRVALFGVDDRELCEEIECTAEAVTYPEIAPNTEVVLRRINSLAEIDEVAHDRGNLSEKGVVWLIFEKGRPDIKAATVIPAGKVHPLVDNRVVRFSAKLTALRFPIPVAHRGRKK